VSTHSNILIIGGGAIGMCTAYYLLQQGVKATIVDKGEMGQACSLHNAGYISPSHFVPLAAPGIISQGLKWLLDPTSPFYIKPRLDLDFISWAWKFRNSCTHENVERAAPLLRDLGNTSRSLFEEMAKVNGMSFEFMPKGLLVLFRTERGRAAQLEEAELAHKLGVGVLFLEKSDIQKLVPETKVHANGGLYFPGDCHITPARFVSDLVRYLEANGVRMMRNCEVKKLTTLGNRVKSIATANGELQADEFILAGGSWSPGFVRPLGIRLPVQAGKGYSVTIRRPDRKPLIPMILSEARVAITPMGDTMRFAGTMEIAGLDLSINQRRVQAILNAIPNYIGGFIPDDFKGGEVWAGLRPVSPDGLPFIGRFNAFPNLISATGHAMLGITLAPVTGKIVADVIAGNKPQFEMSLMHPDRFN
jgi:D-amino-acid dehydrogenase